MRRITVICLLLAATGCATKSNAPVAASAASAPPAAVVQTPGAKTVASTDGSFTGEIVGTPRPGSKFAKLRIGMTMYEVQKLIKAPDDLRRHETGKRWIPFYFGNDAQRLQTYYEGEGCLTYTGGNVFGGGDNQLIRISVNQSSACLD